MKELDIKILEHIRKYPRLSGYDIARALGVQPNVVERAVMRLFLEGLVRWEWVIWPCPGGKKRIWIAVGKGE